MRRRWRARSAMAPPVVGGLAVLVLAAGVGYAVADPRPSFAPAQGGVVGVPTNAQHHVLWVAMPLQFTGTSSITIDSVRLGPHAHGVRLVKVVGIDQAEVAADLHTSGAHYDQGYGDPTVAGPRAGEHFHPVTGWRLSANSDPDVTAEVLLVVDVPYGAGDDVEGVATDGMCVHWHHRLWSGTAHTGRIELEYAPRSAGPLGPHYVPRPPQDGC
ncbi:MAG TPA: hypothetical protein VHE83_06455 [Mycobacteriales bacterium]|nr:hypothetical protein [Mycobacteriales bacterium]